MKKMMNSKSDLVTVRQAAKVLRVHPRTLNRLVREGQVPFYRPSARTTRFDLHELRAFIRGRRLNGK